MNIQETWQFLCNLGRPKNKRVNSPEHRAKISAALKEHYRRKKMTIPEKIKESVDKAQVAMKNEINNQLFGDDNVQMP